MKAIRYFLWGAMMALTMNSAQAADTNIQRFGVYVVVTDIDRSREFYTRLFGKEPYVTNANFIGFDVAGGLYALVAARSLDRKLTRGDSAVPYIRVNDIEVEFARVRDLPARMLDTAIVREGPVSLFRFADPDGNVIEFFAFTAP